MFISKRRGVFISEKLILGLNLILILISCFLLFGVIERENLKRHNPFYIKELQLVDLDSYFFKKGPASNFGYLSFLYALNLKFYRSRLNHAVTITRPMLKEKLKDNERLINKLKAMHKSYKTNDLGYGETPKTTAKIKNHLAAIDAKIKSYEKPIRTEKREIAFINKEISEEKQFVKILLNSLIFFIVILIGYLVIGLIGKIILKNITSGKLGIPRSESLNSVSKGWYFFKPIFIF